MAHGSGGSSPRSSSPIVFEPLVRAVYNSKNIVAEQNFLSHEPGRRERRGETGILKSTLIACL